MWLLAGKWKTGNWLFSKGVAIAAFRDVLQLLPEIPGDRDLQHS